MTDPTFATGDAAAVATAGDSVPSSLNYAPPSQRLYYGWACVAAAALAMVATLPGRTMGLGLATESLIKDFGLTRTEFGTLNLLATLIGAAFGLAAGRAVDRFGVRVVAAGTTLALGLTVLALTRTTSVGGLLILVTLTRGFGQSALSVASIAIVGKWFERRVGRAMAVYSVLLTVGFMIALPSLDAGGRAFGWRAAWTLLGLCLAPGVAVVLWAVVRRGPESVGLAVDGETVVLPTSAGEPAAPADVAGHTLRQAIASPAFWLLAMAGFLFNAAYSAITLFNESILAERGFVGSPTGPLVVMVFAGLAANFVGGWLTTHCQPTRLMAAAMLPLAAAMASLPYVHTQGQVVAYAGLLGLSAGVVTVVFFAGWGQLFGRRHLGQIQGAAQTLTVVASAVGPIALSATRDAAGAYGPFFLGIAGLAVGIAGWGWFLRLPRVGKTHV